jgi:hypothetical protein
MKHKRNTLIVMLCLSLLVALTLVWQAGSAQAGPDLPPRSPVPTPKPGDHDQAKNDNDALVGAYIELSAPDAPAGAWAVVQWQDNDGGWHNVEGWQGALPDSSRWWVHPKDFNTGAFRWVIEQRPGEAIWGMSEPFNLPGHHHQTLQLTISPVR